MAKMARKDLERIVRKEMPGYRLTRKPKSATMRSAPPESPAHPWDRAARPKADVISGKDKKIVGTQG